MPDVLVIGAGTTGLACAQRLAQAGVDVLALEAAPSPGGAMATVNREGYQFESGPNTVQASARTFRELCGELGLADELIVSRPAAGTRFLYHGGALRPLPSGPLSLLTSKLLTASDKRRLVLEPLRKRQPTAGREPDFAAFMAERLGPNAARVLAGAFVRGVYAAEATELGAASAFPRLWELVQEHGGLVRGMLGASRARKRAGLAPMPGPDCRSSALLSFPSGLGRFVEALSSSLGPRLRCGTQVRGLEAEAGGFSAQLDGERISVRDVVIALPAARTVALVEGLLPGYDLPFLRGLGHASVTVVHLGLGNATLPEAFGFLVPPDEPGPKALGVLFPSRIFEGRAPAGCDAVTAIYRTADLEQADPVAAACADLELALGQAPWVVTSKVRQWTNVIPRYGVGHAERARHLLAAAEQAQPGLHLAGNWHGGASVEDCLTRGRRVADKLLARLPAGTPTEVAL
jgi:protoporphyrinogen/coproporphyrinogen III oxidase